ncbi:dihydrolipoamide succinyltransferase, partial [Methylopila musalis]
PADASPKPAGGERAPVSAGSSVGRITLVAAVVIAIGVIAYVLFAPQPAPHAPSPAPAPQAPVSAP